MMSYIIPVRDAIVFPRGRTKVIRIRHLWTRMLSKTENNSPFSKISAGYEWTRPEVWPAFFSTSYKSTIRFLVTNSEEGRSLCRKIHAKLRSVVCNLSTRCCVHLLLYLQGKSHSLQKADLLTEWWVGERVWGWIIADTELFPSGVTTVSECLLCSVLHYR